MFSLVLLSLGATQLYLPESDLASRKVKEVSHFHFIVTFIKVW